MDFLLFNTFFFTLLLFCAFVALGQWRQTKDSLILWYIGYLLFTFAHYGRQCWIVGAEESGFVPPPDPPLHWSAPLSYAAFACYLLFVERLLNMQTHAPRPSYVLVSMVRLFAGMIGLHLLLQVVWGNHLADQMHQVFQLLLFPTMLWLVLHLWRNARLGYQKLILAGTIALVLGFVCVIATRTLDGRYDLIPGAICCFPTRWGFDIPLYHLKVGIAIDVICFSWALTLRQKELLISAAVSALPPAPTQKIIISPLQTLPEDAFKIKIDDFLAQNFHLETLTVGEVAKAVFLSADQVTRKLKGKTGLTTEQYILRYRLERALEMLQTTDLPIGEITLAIGLKDTAHFSRAFKKHYGQNPSEIRKQKR